MSEPLSIQEVRKIVNTANLKEQYHITVKAEAHGACCVEARRTDHENQLAWRKRSFESDFESSLKRFIKCHS